ncbi:Siderophore iron transporter mirb [Scedosporium apiospermum]|uniref:Siderophore iron transporter mirb n=1 Tax=Pseudallescheria apiosperma TaxID=563466 RepID=A0A084G7I0_PSEDA|nr:Siderophore iron transporter mirb [Scedosporium apiospermum]KEZ43292.1 Siderophore iron transporter mirb [Scedosporium apiospermum]
MATIATQPVEKLASTLASQGLDIEKTVSHQQDLGIKDDASSDRKQEGVKDIEAVTTIWDKSVLWMMFGLLYLVSFSDKLLVDVQGNLNPYVTSSFNEHGLTPTVNIVASVIGATCSLTIAKIIDVWGRVEGFVVLLAINLLGNILKAVCKNMYTYAAGHTLYWVGHIGLLYVIDIMLADMTTLRNRIIIYGLNGTPTIATTFAGPKIAELFYNEVNFRWAFGAFAIILVGFCIPVITVLLWHKRKAINSGLILKESSGRTTIQSIWYYVIQFDVGFVLILLPFNLASNIGKGWGEGRMIAMEVVGVVLLVAFALWEKYLAPVQMFPFKFLTDRTIIGACLLYFFMFVSIFCWDAYYISYLQVAHDQSISASGYILNSFALTSAFISPFIGLLIRYTGDFKWFSYGGVPFVALGTTLLIHFRKPETHVGLLVMCQVLNGIGTGIWAMCGELGIMASVSHQEIAVAIAIFYLFGGIGASVGFAIAGGIWVNVLPNQLIKHLPDDAKDQWADIYGSLVIQQEWPVGTPIRDGIIAAYADVQRKMVIAGSAFLPIMLICIFLFKNINVRKLEEEKGKQTKGNVF